MAEDTAATFHEYVLKACKPHGLFYIPETKKDMEDWLDAQRPEMPTGIAVMIGYNYAMNQVREAFNHFHPEYDPSNDELESPSIQADEI